MYMKLSIKPFTSLYTKMMIITAICATAALEGTYHTHAVPALSALCIFVPRRLQKSTLGAKVKRLTWLYKLHI